MSFFNKVNLIKFQEGLQQPIWIHGALIFKDDYWLNAIAIIPDPDRQLQDLLQYIRALK